MVVTRWPALAAALALGLTAAGCASSAGEGQGSESVKGEAVTLIVPNQPGQGMDSYARLIAPYLKDCLDASRVTVKNEPGAGGVVGTNSLWEAEPDGKTLEFTSITAITLAALADSEGVSYDPTKFVYLGRAASEPRVLTAGAKAGIKSAEDLKGMSKPFVYPSPGPDQDFFLAAVLSESIGFPLEYVTGFEGQGDAMLAITKGDATGQIWAYSAAAPFIDSGEQIPLMVTGKERMDELPDVPTAIELVDDPTALEAFAEVNDYHRGFFAPPNMSAELTEEIREGVDCALSNDELLEKAEAAQMPIDPLGGAELQTAIEDLYPKLEEILPPIFKKALDSIK
jgi:tripartite-type tricarboxylate transporter receptor subunit TctC